MRIGVVVVTHESHAVLPGLLDSVRRYEPGADVIVVDSGSADRPDVPHGELVVLSDNVGYGSACNRGADVLFKRGAPQVLAFLNPDVRLRGPSLSELAKNLVSHPRVGVATGPLEDPHGTRIPSAWGRTSALRAFWYASGLTFPRIRALAGRVLSGGPLTSGASSARNDLPVVGHVLGGVMIVRRQCWQQLGGFDEDFFLYWEDADLCERARRLGWEIRVLPCSPIIHHAGTSSEGIGEDARWGWYLEGADLFARKHLSQRRHRQLMVALRSGRYLRRHLMGGVPASRSD